MREIGTSVGGYNRGSCRLVPKNYETFVFSSISGVVCRPRRRRGKPLSICGEIASDTRLLPVLVGLGLEDFAVAVGMLPEVQACLGRMSVTECRELADRCLAADDADEVRTLIADRRACHPRSPPGKSNARPGAAMP